MLSRGERGTAFLPGSIASDATRGFGLRRTAGMADKCGKDRLPSLRCGPGFTMNRRDGCRTVGTLFKRCAEGRIIADARAQRSHAHGAMMNPVPSAAGGQPRFTVLAECQQRQGEHGQQQNGKESTQSTVIQPLNGWMYNSRSPSIFATGSSIRWRSDANR